MWSAAKYVLVGIGGVAIGMHVAKHHMGAFGAAKSGLKERVEKLEGYIQQPGIDTKPLGWKTNGGNSVVANLVPETGGWGK